MRSSLNAVDRHVTRDHVAGDLASNEHAALSETAPTLKPELVCKDGVAVIT